MNLNFNLHPPQMEVFQDPARFKVVAAGRRFGKSYLAAVNLLIEALKDKNEYGYNLEGREVWYIAPTFQQAKDIMWDLLKRLGKDVIESTLENTATARLVNGRTIKLKGSDRPDTLRGVGISYVVMDEFAFMRPEVWEGIVQPTLADVRGKALFIGTPEGKNHFYDLFLQAMSPDSKDWAAFQFKSTDNPFLHKEEITSAANRMSSALYRQEHEASFEASGGGIFKEEWVQYDRSEPSDGFYFISVDPAGYQEVEAAQKSKLKKLDETAISIVKVGPYGWWVREIDAGRWGIRETSVRILKHCREVQPACVGIEQGALKHAIMPYLEDQMRRLGVYPRIVPVTHGNQKKSERIIWALQGRFEHGRITLNKGAWNKKFMDQLLDFPNPMSHDDLIDSLAYIDQISTTNYNSVIEQDNWEPIDDITGF